MNDIQVYEKIIRIVTNVDSKKTEAFKLKSAESLIYLIEDLDVKVDDHGTLLQFFVTSLTKKELPYSYISIITLLIENGADYKNITIENGEPLIHFFINLFLEINVDSYEPEEDKARIEGVIKKLIKLYPETTKIEDVSKQTIVDIVLTKLAGDSELRHDVLDAAAVEIPFSSLLNENDFVNLFKGTYDKKKYPQIKSGFWSTLIADASWENYALIMTDGRSLWNDVQDSNTRRNDTLLTKSICNFLNAMYEQRRDKFQDAIYKIINVLKNPGLFFARLFVDILKKGTKLIDSPQALFAFIASNNDLTNQMVQQVSDMLKSDQKYYFMFYENNFIYQGDEHSIQSLQAAQKKFNISYILIMLKFIQHDRYLLKNQTLNDKVVLSSTSKQEKLKSAVQDVILSWCKAGVDMGKIIEQLQTDPYSIIGVSSKSILHKFSPSKFLGYEGKLKMEIDIIIKGMQTAIINNQKQNCIESEANDSDVPLAFEASSYGPEETEHNKSANIDSRYKMET